MKRFLGLMLLLCVFAGMSLAQGAEPRKSAKGGSAAEELKQVERDWTDATKSGDVNKLSQLIADDWVGLLPDGTKVDKKQYLDGYKSGASKAESVEMGPMDARAIGNAGVVQGSDTEKSTMNGKDSSGKYVWMDVFEKKGGKWQAVRSAITKVG